MLVVVGALGIGASAARALLRTTDQPLTGSQFQGGDGNQNEALPLTDWQTLAANGRFDHTTDPNANDDIFAGGNKELDPDGWSFTTQTGGSTPGAGNILDFYRATQRAISGDAFLYLAFTRFSNTGTVYVTFELNQDTRLWRNAAGAEVPCRTTGDILITFIPHGNDADVLIERWVTNNPPAPTVGSCARQGHVVPANLTAAEAQVSFNNPTAPIDNFLPGFYPIGPGTIDQQKFGEAAINLTSALADNNFPCTVFGSTWMHSRSSSAADAASMKDYVVPAPFHLRTCKATPALKSSASGLLRRGARRHRLRRHRRLSRSLEIYDTATLSDGDNPTGTITFRLYGPGDDTCSQDPVFTSTAEVMGNGSYRSGSFAPTRVGTYRWRVTYSGDDDNESAGPTKCGLDTETVAISAANPSLTSTASGPLEPTRSSGPRRHTTRAARPITDTATLEGGIAPTGTITFHLYGPNDGDCSHDPIFTSEVPVNGNGSYTSAPFTPMSAGTYRWRVTYSGDANNNKTGPTECGIASETTVIEPAHPKIFTVATPSAQVGDAIHDSATLTGGADPTGTITFKVFGPGDTDCGTALDTSTVTVSGNDTYTSAPFIANEQGKYRWIASYSGDKFNEPVATSCGDLGESSLVGPPPPVQPTLTTTSPATATAGSAIRDTAHLRDGDDPTGTITFKVYGPRNPDCEEPSADQSTVAVDNGNGDYESAPFTPTEAGTYRWRAVYSGDDRNKPAGPTGCHDTDETVVVSKAQPALTTRTAPTIPLGGTTRDRATLTGGSEPTGHITFRLYGPNDATCSAANLVFTAEATVDGNGVYRSPRFAPDAAGRYRWVATYSGDDNNEGASTACGDAGETVRVLRNRPHLTTSASPRAFLRATGPRVRAAGLPIYDAANLTGGFSPTGKITFTLFGPDDPTCAGAPIFTSIIQVNGNDIYNSDRFTATAAGTYRWIATYSGDANNHPAGPTACDDPAEQVTVTPPSDTELSTTASPAVTLGGAIHDTAHLSEGSDPTGTIRFQLFAPADDNCSGPAIFTSTVNVAGNGDYVSDSYVPTAVGAYRWVAKYTSGDARNKDAGPTACGDESEIAVVRTPTVVPVIPVFSTTASAAQGPGTPIDDVAHLNGALAPLGSITFSLFGPDNATCSGPPIFTSTVAVTGNGDYRSESFIPPLAGTYRWVAEFSGDALNAGSGPTACGDSTETTVVESSGVAGGGVGPNVPTPPPPRHTARAPSRAKHKARPKRVRPIVTG